MSSAHPATRKGEQRERTGPVRENVVAFAAAIAIVVLFKYFVVEAYVIPTSSMQPTLMGSSEAGVFDRLFVDKRTYEVRDPKRWDVAVFRYPIRRFQNYVKRIVGEPGDRIRIGGGNLYLVEPEGDGEKLTTLRKPDSVQAGLWRELFPRGVWIEGGRPLGDHVVGSPTNYWKAVDGSKNTFRMTQERRGSGLARLSYGGRMTQNGELTDVRTLNRVYDGYPAQVAREIRDDHGGRLTGDGSRPEHVQDLRITATLKPEGEVGEASLVIEVDHEPSKQITFALRVLDGQGKIVVEVDRKEQLASESFPVKLGAGTSTTLRLEHVDDLCRAFVDGSQTASLDTSAFRLMKPVMTGTSTGVTAKVEIRKAKPLTVADLRIERDLHYLPSSEEGHVVEVPEGHYFMMGDNTQQSVDGRDWTEVTVAVGADGEMLDPMTADPSLPRIRGNFRVRQVGGPVDADENPVPAVMVDRVGFTDHIGEVHSLRGRPSLDGDLVWGENGVVVKDENDHVWTAPTGKNQFVLREDILGRALFRFWPYYRIGPIL